jgi:hypothetical protein
MACKVFPQDVAQAGPLAGRGEGMKIGQRINAVRRKVSYAKKDKAVQGQGYKAVTHDAVTALLRNELIENGIIVVPRFIRSEVVIVGMTKNETPIIRYAALYEIDFANEEDMTDKVTVPMEAHANDHGDKAPGKAVSYATKYAMLKLFNIETGEDDEGRAEPYANTQPLSANQIAIIYELIDATGSDEAKLLAFAKAGSVEEIRPTDYQTIVAMLKKKLPAEIA